MDETTTSMAQASGSGDWWRRNRLWLVGAVVLGALAFWLPYRDAVREFRDKREPSHPQDVAAGTWQAYEGARWRLVGVRRQDGLAETFAGYPHDASSLVVVAYEVIPDPGTSGDTLDRCRGRLSDASGRVWQADAMPRASLSGPLRKLGTSCGSRAAGGLDREQARPGQAFRFYHLYQVPSSVQTESLRGEITFPPMTTTPPGRYVRFALDRAGAGD